MQKCLVTFIGKPWSFVDENSGEVKEGFSLEYLMTDALVPFENDDGYGYKRVKASLPLSEYPNVSEVPGVYDLDFDFKVAANGKANLNLKSFKFVKKVS